MIIILLLKIIILSSNLVDNLTHRIYKTKCKNFDSFLEYKKVEDDLIKYKCSSCNEDYSNKLGEKLKKKFKNTFKFYKNEINKFILLLRNDIYEYMDN